MIRFQDSRIPGFQDSRIPRFQDSKIPRFQIPDSMLYSLPFAEHDFGPFGHIFFVIIILILLEPESKTLFIVLFSSLCYFQACVLGFSSFISVFTEYLYF
jgi:hypothetical protein